MYFFPAVFPTKFNTHKHLGKAYLLPPKGMISKTRNSLLPAQRKVISFWVSAKPQHIRGKKFFYRLVFTCKTSPPFLNCQNFCRTLSDVTGTGRKCIYCLIFFLNVSLKRKQRKRKKSLVISFSDIFAPRRPTLHSLRYKIARVKSESFSLWQSSTAAWAGKALCRL